MSDSTHDRTYLPVEEGEGEGERGRGRRRGGAGEEVRNYTMYVFCHTNEHSTGQSTSSTHHKCSQMVCGNTLNILGREVVEIMQFEVSESMSQVHVLQVLQNGRMDSVDLVVCINDQGLTHVTSSLNGTVKKSQRKPYVVMKPRSEEGSRRSMAVRRLSRS